MFSEPYNTDRGWIEVICGSMFSGKTEELLRRLRRVQIRQQLLVTAKPAQDTRWEPNTISSRTGASIPAKPFTQSTELLTLAKDTQVLAIDEAQFADSTLPQVVQTLSAKPMRIILCGLDMDFTGKPFGPMPQLLAIANHILKVHALCHNCGYQAVYSYRSDPSTNTILLGDKDSYKPLCRDCWNTLPNTKQLNKP